MMSVKILVCLANLITKNTSYSSAEAVKTAGTYLLVILVVVFLAYYSTKMLSKVNLFSGSTKYMKVIDKLAISNDKSIILISVNDRVEMIGVDKNSMIKIDDFDGKDFDIDSVEVESKSTKSFTEILNVRKGKKLEK